MNLYISSEECAAYCIKPQCGVETIFYRIQLNEEKRIVYTRKNEDRALQESALENIPIIV